MTTDQWVVFRLAARDYAIPLQRVVEVLWMVAIRPVPDGPAWLAGVINLRGRMLPIMDLRTRLGLPAQAPRLETRIIVAEVGQRWIGLLVDEALEVLTEPAAAIDLPALLPGAAGRNYAAVRAHGRLVPVFDLEGLSADAQALAMLEA